MSIPPPPPPPLDSLPKLNLTTKAKPKEDDISNTEQDVDLDICKLLARQPRPLYVLDLCMTYVAPQLQNGPTCGLVALSMALSTLGIEHSVDMLLQHAITSRFTKQGEMFSATNLCKLALHAGAQSSRVVVGPLLSHLDCILRALVSGCVLLIPYDSDKNHYPCKRSGHRAHWAIVCGYMISMHEVQEIKDTTCQKGHHDSNDATIVSCRCTTEVAAKNGQQIRTSYLADDKFEVVVATHSKNSLLPVCFNGTVVNYLQTEGQNPAVADPSSIMFSGKTTDRVAEVYLICREAKSKQLYLWSLYDLEISNSNLMELSPNRSLTEYVVPPGGLEEGLCNQFIVLS